MKTWEEMSDEEQGALLLAHHRGESIQNKATGVWLDAPKPMWRGGGVYRVKPKPIENHISIKMDYNGYTGYATLLTVDGVPQNATLKWDIHQ